MNSFIILFIVTLINCLVHNIWNLYLEIILLDIIQDIHINYIIHILQNNVVNYDIIQTKTNETFVLYS
jgi:hypothetical protein